MKENLLLGPINNDTSKNYVFHSVDRSKGDKYSCAKPLTMRIVQ